jgi:hypothetical protein
VLATLWNRRILAYLSGAYYWQDFYRAEHPTQALGITVAIIDAFVRDTRQQQRRGAVVVFPTRGDLVARGRGKPWSYQPLLAALQARGLTPLNVGDGLFERLPQGDPDAIIGAAGQHYNELGNRLVAEIVGRFIEENGLRPSANEEHS